MRRLDKPGGVWEAYEGDFFEGVVHGDGVKIWSDGSQYEGEYNSGRRHGNGKAVYHDGSMFDGMWKEDKREGSGKFDWSFGATIPENMHLANEAVGMHQ